MSDNDQSSEFARIRNQLSLRSRHVEIGCVIKVSYFYLFRDAAFHGKVNNLYGIVGNQCDFCKASSAGAYDVEFFEDVKISSHLVPILSFPVFENDMHVIRFPEQCSSLDDPLIDQYFTWIHRNCIRV